MADRYPPINPKCTHLLHGADYNPDQWPEAVWTEDMRLMNLAGCNVANIGIFAWARLEPEEGRYDFGWLDRIMDLMADHGVYAVLATPSGARPAWMSQRYPEVLRVNADRQRILHGRRHNHCYTSPVYREKVTAINALLAQRYADHPALLVWHLSNEYNGECHCELCQAAFREWVRRRYEDDLEAVNQAWWTAFWAHRYSDWSQIESPAPHGETSVHGLNLDWKRFVTEQTCEFIRVEKAPLRHYTPDIPITTNFMGTYPGLDYWKLAAELDVISWDNYPCWHGRQSDAELAAWVGFVHDINRSMKAGRPWMLMESTPSMTNWQEVAKLKRPGMHILSSLQAVAHGSDTVQYFQWRKSRGASEKFHGAVVDHVGHEQTRVFREVATLGELMGRLDDVVGTTVRPEVAVVYDWEVNWVINDAQGPRRANRDYPQTCAAHYRPFWELGIPVDVIDADQPLDGYKLLIAPMLHLIRPGVAERIGRFVEAGGTFVATYWTGIVNETDLCWLTGFPGPLRALLGIWSEEIDALYETDQQGFAMAAGNPLGLTGDYAAKQLCDLVWAETAEVAATYTQDFYAGRPAVTVNRAGRGEAWYLAARTDGDFLSDFYGALAARIGLRRTLEANLPPGVTAQLRTDGERRFIFLLNFSGSAQTINVGPHPYTDLLTGDPVSGEVAIEVWGVRVLAD